MIVFLPCRQAGGIACAPEGLTRQRSRSGFARATRPSTGCGIRGRRRKSRQRRRRSSADGLSLLRSMRAGLTCVLARRSACRTPDAARRVRNQVRGRSRHATPPRRHRRLADVALSPRHGRKRWILRQSLAAGTPPARSAPLRAIPRRGATAIVWGTRSRGVPRLNDERGAEVLLGRVPGKQPGQPL